MKLRIVESKEGFHALKDAWNGLAERMDGGEAFFRWEWCEARMKHALPADEELFLVVAEEEDGRTAGIAPLAIGRAGPWRGRVLRTLTGDHADYGAFLLGPEWNHHSLLGKMFGLLVEHRHRWDVMHLLNFSSRNPQTHLIPEVMGDGLRCAFTERMPTPWLPAADHPAKAVRSRLKTVERRERALRREHAVEVVIGGPFREELWQRLVALHLEKWPESVFRDPSHGNFLREVIAALEPAGRTEISWMTIDGELAALHFGFRMPHKAGYYIPATDARFQQHAPGAILLSHLLAHHAGAGREFDFLRGNEDYKFHWTDRVAVNHHLLIHHGGGRSRALAAFLRAKDRLRGMDGLRKLVRRLKGR